MRPPIFVYEPDDLSVFDELWKAERYIEPYDIGDLFFYDSDGLLLAASAETDEKGFVQCVRFEPGEQVYQPEKLREIIIDALESIGVAHPELRSSYNREISESYHLSVLVSEISKYATE